MKINIQEHTETQTAVNTLKEILDNAVKDRMTVQDIERITKNFCFTCMQTPPEFCDLCNNHPRKE